MREPSANPRDRARTGPALRQDGRHADRGTRRRHRRGPLPSWGTGAARHGATVTAIVNVGDDVTLHGLRICPDLDSVMYTLGGGADPERGWGRAGETWAVKDELAAYGAEPTWFGLGDKDVATHLVRTRMLDAGYPLSAVTEALCDRWQPGRAAAAGHRRPAGDPRRGHPDRERAIHFQEWWVRYRARLPAQRFVFVGAESAKPAAGVPSTRWPAADVVLVAPSNPVVSHRADPRRDRAAGRARRRGRRRSSGSPRSSAAPRCAGWPTSAWPRSRYRVHRGRRRLALRCPGRRRPARRLAGRHGPTPVPAVAGVRGPATVHCG